MTPAEASGEGPSATPRTMKLKNVKHSTWTPITIEMLSTTAGTPEKMEARKTVFEYSGSFGTSTCPVTAFVSSKSRAIWIGPEQDFHVELDSGITGGRLVNGFLLWCDSIAHNQNATNDVDSAIREFESARELGELLAAEVPGPDFETKAKRSTDLRKVFNVWAFSAGKENTAISRTTKLLTSEIHGKEKELKLTIENPASEFKGEVWIDVRTRKITKATEGGKQVFPK